MLTTGALGPNITRNDDIFYTCVSVSFKFLLSCNLFATLRYLFLSNSASSDFICDAVNAVLGRFFLSSSLDALRLSSSASFSSGVRSEVKFASLLLQSSEIEI